MLRESLYRRVIGIALGAAALVALGMGFFGEVYFRSNIEAERERAFAEVASRVQLLDLMLGKAEKAMLAQGRQALGTIAKDYGSQAGLDRLDSLGLHDLGRLARGLGVADIYLINPANLVVATSLRVDEGLDLSKFGPDFIGFLDGVRGQGRIFDESITVSGQTGAIKAYQYYSPKGSRWIVEVSSGLDAWFPQFAGGLSYADFISVLFSPFIKPAAGGPIVSFDVVRWSVAGSWSLIKPGTPRYLDEKTVAAALDTGEDSFLEGSLEHHYRFLGWKSDGPSFADPRIVDLVVDLQPLRRFAISILLAALLACAAAGIFAFIAVRSFFDRSFVARVEDLQTSIKRVAAGETGVSFDSGGEDELSFIGRSIETMIEEIRKAEESLRNARAAEAVGIMASGLAHDINNILAGAVGAASILRNRLEEEGSVPEEELVSSLVLIEHTGERGEILVRDLLALARLDRPPPCLVDLGQVVSEVVDFMRVSAPTTVRIDLALPPEGARPEILGSAENLERVLMNLCRNGIQAMTEMRPPEKRQGGTLSVSLAAHGAGTGDPDSWAVSVRDEGEGISPDIMAKLFTPFFSTKPHRGGSGLGLSASRAIAEAHGGRIEVETVLGEGSTFTLYLPLPNRPAEAC